MSRSKSTAARGPARGERRPDFNHNAADLPSNLAGDRHHAFHPVATLACEVLGTSGRRRRVGRAARQLRWRRRVVDRRHVDRTAGLLDPCPAMRGAAASERDRPVHRCGVRRHGGHARHGEGVSALVDRRDLPLVPGCARAVGGNAQREHVRNARRLLRCADDSAQRCRRPAQGQVPLHVQHATMGRPGSERNLVRLRLRGHPDLQHLRRAAPSSPTRTTSRRPASKTSAAAQPS